MKHISVWLSIIILGNTYLIEKVNAIDITSPSYTYWMKYSDRVARVKIIERKAIKCVESGKLNFCGWLLTAKVIKSWKGGEDDFTFFTPYEDNYIGSDRDYFVLAKKGITFSDVKEIGLLKECKACDYETVQCDGSTYEYTAIPNVQSVFPFDIQAAKETGDEWLILLNRPVNAQISIMSEFRDIYENDEENPSSFKYTIQKWVDFLNDMINGAK